MSLLSHGMKLIKAALNPAVEWKVRRETTLRETLIVLACSVYPLGYGMIDGDSAWYPLWISSIFLGAGVLFATRLARLGRLDVTPDYRKKGHDLIPKDNDLTRRSAEEGHESAISFVAIFVSCLIVSVFKLIELASYRIFEFILTWW